MSDNNVVGAAPNKKHVLEPGISATIKIVTPDTNDEKDNKETNNK